MTQDSEEMQKTLGELEKEAKPRKAIKDEVEKQLKPLFAKFYPSSEQYMLYKKYEVEFKKKYKRIYDFLDRHTAFIKVFSNGISKEPYVEAKKHFNFVAAITYLLETELIGTVFVDQALLLLIGGGVDFHLEPDYKHRYTRHATSLEELEAPFLSLSVKLDFLSINGLTFFSKWLDRNLRNKIAHLDYEINDKGDFCLKGKRKPVDLQDKISTFKEYFFCVLKVFLEEEARITKK